VTRVLEVLGQSTGGVGKHVSEVVKALDGSGGLTVDIAAPVDLRAPMPKAVIGVPIPGGMRGHARAVRRLRRTIVEGRYDLVHGHGLRAGMDAALAGRGAGVPALVTLHNLIVPEVSGGIGARVYRRIEPLVVGLSARTLVPSREMAERLAEDAPRFATRIEVLYAGVAEVAEPQRTRTDVRAELDVDDDAGLVVTVARLHPQKALSVMLEAIALVEEEAVLAIVGEGPSEDELRARSAALGLGPRVRFLGWRSNAADIIAAADVFCLSSVWEAVPLAAQEAVLVGTPVVATDVGGLDELITDGASGRLVPSGDPRALAAALRETLASDVDRKKFAEQARADYSMRFNRERILERLREIYVGYERRV
jgi:glycosyltransferase involved in cell wall biosynthesis